MAIFQIEGEELIEKEVGRQGDVGRIYLHKKYIGQRVKIIILNNHESGTSTLQGGEVK